MGGLFYLIDNFIDSKIKMNYLLWIDAIFEMIKFEGSYERNRSFFI
jgi:hypothetical protein